MGIVLKIEQSKSLSGKNVPEAQEKIFVILELIVLGTYIKVSVKPKELFQVLALVFTFEGLAASFRWTFVSGDADGRVATIVYGILHISGARGSRNSYNYN